MNNLTKRIAWNEFFQIRKKNELKRKLFGIPGVFGFLTVEGAVLSMPIYDATFTVFGLDPLVVIGLSTITGSVGGYYASRMAGNFIWRKMNPQLSLELDQVQK